MRCTEYRNTKLFCQWMPCCLLMAFLCWLQGCASSTSTSRASSSLLQESHRPVLHSDEVARHQQPFIGRLPLGIGARFDLFIADAASGMGDFYSSYVSPIRKGKIFSRQPYQLDYSILPKSGEAFQKKGSLFDTVSFKSDYKFQVGVSRNFVEISDFLKPAFWLGTGRFSTAPSNKANRWSQSDPSLNRLSDPQWNLDLNQPSDIDFDSWLDERWGLTP